MLDHSRYRILVVDDEPGIRTTAQAVLESQGYQVDFATDGFEGLLVLKQFLPHIIISDLRMPNMNGFEFLSVVRLRFPEIPVIAISGEFFSESEPESVLADAFFEKGSYSPMQLFEKILELLRDLPSRPKRSTTATAPVWIRQSEGRKLAVLTCSYCLRTFPLEGALVIGIHETKCDFCASTVQYEITNVVLARDSTD